MSGPETVVPRRRDRAHDEAWIRAYLARAPWGVLAVADDGGGPPHVNANIFVHRPDPDRIYVHTARLGATRDRLDTPDGAAATFTAATMGRLLPADTALEFSVEYSGVIVAGRARYVSDSDEATLALHLLLDRYAPHLERGRDYRAVVPDELKRTAVYRLDVERWSGKQKAVGEHAGAFRLPELPLPFDG